LALGCRKTGAATRLAAARLERGRTRAREHADDESRAVAPLLAVLQNRGFCTPSRLERLRALTAASNPNSSRRRLSCYFTGR
jgi:hypothetical protein